MDKSWVGLRWGNKGALGRDVNSSGTVRLKEPERSTYVIGTPGMGKSTLLLNLILEDIRKADKGLVVLDPHAELVEEVLLRCPTDQADRVIYFSPMEQTQTPFGLNPFEWYEDKEYERKIEAVMTVFTHLWYGGFRSTPTLQDTLATLVRTLFSAYQDHQVHFYHLQLLLQNDDIGEMWREQLSQYVANDPILITKWKEWETPGVRKSDTGSSKNKIHYIISNRIIQNILCQPTSSDCFHFQETLAAKKVLLVNLGGLGAESIRLVGSIILTQILAMAYLRKEEDKVPCHIYADEFYNFPAQAFVELINQTRKYKVFCTLAHQDLSQLEGIEAQTATTNCGNKVVFKINPSDAKVLTPHFVQDPIFPESGLSELSKYEAMVKLASSRDTKQAHIKTFREQGKKNEAVAEQIRQQSLIYGRPHAKVEEDIRKLTQGSSGESDEPFWYEG